MSFIVGIDGPAGTGKGTITNLVAKDLNLSQIDTGAMYRAFALYMLDNNVALDDMEKIKDLLDKVNIDLIQENDKETVFLNGKDVSLEIRTKQVNENVSPVSAIGIVRTKMADLQREMAKTIDVIMEGRDIGTNVFPNADVKIYLDATPEERAKRRYLQNKENGIEIPFEEILENVKQRDYIDSTREIAPLKKAEDAIYIDSSNMSIDEVVNEIKQIIIKKRTE